MKCSPLLVRFTLVMLFLTFIILPFIHVINVSFHATLAHPGIQVGEISWINFQNIWLRPELRYFESKPAILVQKLPKNQ